MSIDKHVVSLELAKQLYEAGIVVENPQFVWRYSDEHPEGVIISPVMSRVTSESIHTVPAPLASELGELLPEQIEGHCCIEIGKYLGKWVVQYAKIDNELGGFRVDEDTEANARAKMLLYIKERGLL